MANRYIDISATFNGDGTTSAQAASAGAPGAWNEFRNSYNNLALTAGTLSAGDNVYIRTKNGTNLTESGSGTFIGNSVATAAAPINWIFDDGQVWPGDSGVFTLQNASGLMAYSDYNNFVCPGHNFVYETTYLPSGSFTFLQLGSFTGIDMTFQTPVTTLAKQCIIKDYVVSSTTVLHNPVFNLGMGNTSTTTAANFVVQNGWYLKMINPTIDITGSYLARNLIAQANDGGHFEVIGGKLIGADDTTYLAALGGYNDQQTILDFDGFEVGNDINLENYHTSPNATTTEQSQLRLYNTQGDLHRCAFIKSVGSVDWTPGRNYPTLNAVLPDVSNTAWSFKAIPTSNAGAGNPLQLPTLTKEYDLTAATKKITVEMLLNEALPTPTNAQVYAMATWVDDTTGDIKTVTSYDPTTNLSASTAGWSAAVYGALTTYGEKNYNKFKIEMTTTTAIKQDTQVTVHIFLGVPSTNADDYFFIDPDFTLTTP